MSAPATPQYTLDFFRQRIAQWLRQPQAYSSWILPQRGFLRTQVHVPSTLDLPAPSYVLTKNYGLTNQSDLIALKLVVFNYGFGGEPPLSTCEVRSVVYSMEIPVLVWGLTGVNDQIPEEELPPSTMLQIYQTHQCDTKTQQPCDPAVQSRTWQRQWFSKSLFFDEIVGLGQNPWLFKSPIFVDQGDTLECEVKNVSPDPAPAPVQVVLFCRQLQPVE